MTSELRGAKDDTVAMASAWTTQKRLSGGGEVVESYDCGTS